MASQLMNGSRLCLPPPASAAVAAVAGAAACEQPVAAVCPAVVAFLGNLARFLELRAP
jgi:hypothetical protein